jgi:hypothetical protein
VVFPCYSLPPFLFLLSPVDNDAGFRGRSAVRSSKAWAPGGPGIGIGWGCGLRWTFEGKPESAQFATAFGVFEPVAFALGFKDVAAVGEPIELGPGEAVAAEDSGPVLEWQVGRHDQAVSFVIRGDDVEQDLLAGT